MVTIRIRGPQPGIASQLELIREWSVIATFEWAMIRAELLPVYRSEFLARSDQEGPSFPRSLTSVLASMTRSLVRLVPVRRLRRATMAAGVSTDRTNGAAYDRQLSEAIGIPVTVRPRGKNALIAEWVREATGLITSVRDRAIPGLRVAVEQAWAEGLSALELEQRLVARGLPLNFGTVQGRTRVIARDQIGKLNGRLNELRQRAMGVSTYTWRDAADSDVRPVHRARRGRRFSWNKPPRGGHPGEPVQCRCAAEATVRLEVAVRQPEVVRVGSLGVLAAVAAVGLALSPDQ